MSRISFGDFELDLDLYSLSRDGQPVPLGAKPIDLLICLIENRNRIVDREFLCQEVWNSAKLSPAAIPTCVLELRRALNDDAANPKFIRSHRARGYKFICDIRRTGKQSVNGAKRHQKLKFVGRTNELELLRVLAHTSKSLRKGQVALITGEAGIGKTRLLEEFIATQRKRTAVFSARSPGIDGAPAFYPWIQLLNDALMELGSSNTQLVNNASQLARTFPEIAVPKHAREIEASPPDKFAIFSQWAKTIRSIARHTPVVLCFEDVHRGEPDSLSLLYWISDELSDDPILLIATHRPYPADGPAADIVSEISAMPQTTQLTLGPLSGQEISSLLDPMLGDRGPIGESIARRTGGNAFYVTHLVRCLDDIPDLDIDGSLASSMPLNGREILVRQLSDLPTTTHETLTAASVLGDSFGADALARILDITPADAVTSLEPAIRAWLVRRDGAVYRFNHSLLRDALYESTTLLRRQELHLLVAYDQSELDDAASMSAQIADHFLLSMPLAPASQVCRFTRVAGQEAAARFAHARSRTYFEHALAVSKLDKEASPSDQFGIMIELAQATLYCGDRTKSREILIEAARIARSLNAPKWLAECALNLAPNFLSIEVGAYDPVLIGLLEEAIEGNGESNLALLAQLQARLSQALQWDTTGGRTEDMAKAALISARSSADSQAILAALSARAESLHGPKRAEMRLPYLRELGEIARRTSNIQALLLQRTRLMTAYLELGEIREIEIENERYKKSVAEVNLPQYRWYPGSTDCMLSMLRGDLIDADTFAESYREAAGANPDQNFIQTFAAQHVLRELERDQSSRAVALVTEFADRHKTVLSWSAAIPWFNWDSGRESDAMHSLNCFGEKEVNAMACEPGGGIGLALLSEVAVALGSSRHVKILYEIVSPIANRSASAGYGVAYLGSFGRYAGLLALSLGEIDIAVRYLTMAVDAEMHRGARSWYGYAQIDLHHALRRASRKTRADTTTQFSLLPGTSLEELPRLNRRLGEL